MARILIIDDDPDVVESVGLFLQREGHETVSAYNRKEGMKAVSTADPDLLVLDVMMEQPDDGISMAQELRRQGFKKPILMLTSIGKVTGMKFGVHTDLVPVDAFCEKPIEPEVLVEKVAGLLKGKEG
jgi:DNA-binding response OmpR family regulator